MSCVVSVNVHQAFGETELKLKIRLPKVTSNCGLGVGSNGELRVETDINILEWRKVMDTCIPQACRAHRRQLYPEAWSRGDWLSL